MQANRFVTLTGHLSNYPLSDLVGILRHQRKSGRLTIEFPKGPAIFFFHDGELVDAQLNDLTGLQAVCVALSQPESSFNFNPLIRPTRRSIEPPMQRVVSELLGCWDESALQIEGVAVAAELPRSASSNTPEPVLPPAAEVRLLPPASSSLSQRRSLLFIASLGLLLLGLSTVIAVTGKFNSVRPAAEVPKTDSSQAQLDVSAKGPSSAVQKRAAVAESLKSTRTTEQLRRQSNQASKQEPKATTNSTEAASPNAASVNESRAASQSDGPTVPSVNVILQIENGRVLKASIANHKAGMDSYEGLALRIARQRRYPAKQSGEETVKINVARPD